MDPITEYFCYPENTPTTPESLAHLSRKPTKKIYHVQFVKKNVPKKNVSITNHLSITNFSPPPSPVKKTPKPQ